MAKCNINGVVVEGDLTIRNGEVLVNNKLISKDKIINILIEGNVDKLEIDYCSIILINGNTGQVNTVSGDIVLNECFGDITTTSGDVECHGNCNDVTTTSGDVNINIIKGSVNTISGDIDLKR